MSVMRLIRYGLMTAVLLGGFGMSSFAREDKKAEEGKAAPEFELVATQIEKILPDKKDAKTISVPKDVKGKNVVLFFFPKALTGG
jgi:hypothetical protein